MNKSFEDLKVWQRAVDLADDVYKHTRNFPNEERYGLASQMRRAAVSIASNIAEGCARNSSGEFIQFLGIARGSLAELKTQAIIAKRNNFLNEITFSQLVQQMDEVSRMLSGLKRQIQSARNSELATRNLKEA